MSKSRGTFIMARTYLEHLNPEYLRYYFAAKLTAGVDDMDLNLEDFTARVNSDLVGKVVNIASRSAGFIQKRFDGKLGTVDGKMDESRPGSSSWLPNLIPSSAVDELPVMVGEPFWMLGHVGIERSQRAVEEWRVQVEQQLAPCPCVRFVPQVYMAMVAHSVGSDGDALVLNMGMRECVAVAVVGGEIVQASVQRTPLGGSTLTMLLLQTMAAQPQNSWLRNEDMTWCRDMKERHCFCRLPGQEEDEPSPALVDRPRPEALEHRCATLDEERWKIPEALFAPTQYGLEGRSVTALLLAAAGIAAGRVGSQGASATAATRVARAQHVLRRLLGSIIVVGGGADMPNFRERVELEVEQSARTAAATKALVQAIEEEGDDAVPLEAAVLRTRFRAAEAVFQGGCLLSASASALARSTVSSGEKPAPAWLSKAATGPGYAERCRASTQAIVQ